jgi:ADP-ribose pyrophosphatase
MKIHYTGKFLKLVEKDGWEWVTRENCRTVIMVLPLLGKRQTIFVEQFRPPVGCSVIEFPAGLVGDGEDYEEDLEEAVRRELEEETGYLARKLTHVFRGPASAGACDEVNEVFLAEELQRVSGGGGVEGENIKVHIVDLGEVESWLRGREAEGMLVDLKVWGGLYILKEKADLS